MQIELRRICESSRINRVGYDAASQTLGIEFPGSKKEPAGRIYYYDEFPEELYEDFISSDSLGRFFIAHIKGKFHARRIGFPPDHAAQEATASVGVQPQTADTGAELLALPGDEDALRLRAREVSEHAQSLAITSPQQYELAASELLRITAEKKVAQARVDEIKKPAYAAYQATLKLEHDVIDPYSRAEQWLKGGMSNYRAREEQARRQEERRLQAEAAAKAKAEAEAKAREIAAHQSDIARAEGDTEKAEAILQAPLPLVPVAPAAVILPREVPKVQGIVEVRSWAFRRVNDDEIPRQYCSPDDKKIRAVVRALGPQANIPGIEVYEEISTRARA